MKKSESKPHVTSQEPATEQELDRVLDVLRQRISIRELPPHARLQEHMLAEEFGVSRLRIREVLLALQQRGLVERQPNRSARVIKLDAKQVLEIFDVREYLEGLAVRLAVEKHPPEYWQGLKEMYQGPMERYAADGELELYIRGVDYVRHFIIDAADNATLKDALDRIFDRSKAIVDRTLMLPGRVMEGLRQMQAIIAAMREGDALKAERLRRENIRSQRECFQRYQSLVL